MHLEGRSHLERVVKSYLLRSLVYARDKNRGTGVRSCLFPIAFLDAVNRPNVHRPRLPVGPDLFHGPMPHALLQPQAFQRQPEFDGLLLNGGFGVGVPAHHGQQSVEVSRIPFAPVPGNPLAVQGFEGGQGVVVGARWAVSAGQQAALTEVTGEGIKRVVWWQKTKLVIGHACGLGDVCGRAQSFRVGSCLLVFRACLAGLPILMS